MDIVIFLTSIYAFFEIFTAGYVEIKDNNKACGYILILLSVFCLIAPNLF